MDPNPKQTFNHDVFREEIGEVRKEFGELGHSVPPPPPRQTVLSAPNLPIVKMTPKG